MKVQTPDHMAHLLGNRSSPCISIYMSTQRAKPPAAENPPTAKANRSRTIRIRAYRKQRPSPGPSSLSLVVD